MIGILGEYDALPGLGQEAVPFYSPIPGPGHGCGHNLMAAGTAAAAAALCNEMREQKISGTLIYYGCPAEEDLYGKLWMCKEGMFDELDICAAWHDGGDLRIAEFMMQSCRDIRFDFYGRSAHAACEPWLGRSALDAAELTNIGVQYLREHIKDTDRVHYSYLNGGERPNIVPAFASVLYFLRAENSEELDLLQDRVIKIAKGAAMMTETEVKVHLGPGNYESLINHTLNRAMKVAVEKIPPIVYTQEEIAFAEELYKNTTGVERRYCLPPADVQPLTGKEYPAPGTSDITDVTQLVPTVQLFGQGGLSGPGMTGHHWSVVATSGMSIGYKGAIFAAKALAQFGYDMFLKPEVIAEAQEEFEKSKQGKVPYKSRLQE